MSYTIAPPVGHSLQVDFTSLAVRDEDFAAVYQANGYQVDWHDPKAVQQLTSSILRHYFNLKIVLANDRLCPPVPIRFEYIRWIQALVDSTDIDYLGEYNAERQIIGIDVGVGSSCIYPLLGCANRPNWRFGATEVDDVNFKFAIKNVELNQMRARIRVVRSSPAGPVLPLDTLGVNNATFTMCNPPFYSSAEDMQASLQKKTYKPHTVCTGAPVEMITQGGELAFVLRIVNESAKTRDKVQWYSSMLGKLETASPVVARLQEIGVQNWCVSCFAPGNHTRRWVVAWSFGNHRPRNDVARGNVPLKHVLPFPTERSINGLSHDDSVVASAIQQALDGLDLDWKWHPQHTSGICVASGNVWSRAARRKKNQERDRSAPKAAQGATPGQSVSGDDTEDDEDAAFVARVTVAKAQGEVAVRWLKGADSVVYESFCGMLQRELRKNAPRPRMATEDKDA